MKEKGDEGGNKTISNHVFNVKVVEVIGGIGGGCIGGGIGGCIGFDDDKTFQSGFEKDWIR